MIYDATENRLAEVNPGLGHLRNAKGNTVCQISKEGEATGASGSLLGVFENFSFHKLELVALYLFLVDGEMLMEFAEENSS